MNYRNLGLSPLQISEIGFGCMSLSSNSEKENIDLIHHAMDFGINFFDTADLYDKGMNEIVVGKALKGIRDKVILATKVGNQWRSDGSGWDWNPNKSYILSSVEESLKRLQTDHIDLYQLHGGTIDDPIDETIEAFELLKHQGKIRYYGISSIRPNVIREYVKKSSIVSVMMQYSVLDRRPEETITDLLSKNHISILARGVLAQGLLINKPCKEYLNRSKEEVQQISRTVNSLSGVHRSPAQTAIQFALHNSTVASAIIGIRNKDQLKEVSTIAQSLTQEEIRLLNEAAPMNKYELHL